MPMSLRVKWQFVRRLEPRVGIPYGNPGYPCTPGYPPGTRGLSEPALTRAEHSVSGVQLWTVGSYPVLVTGAKWKMVHLFQRLVAFIRTSVGKPKIQLVQTGAAGTPSTTTVTTRSRPKNKY
eukprot:1727076-Rhodomonas_salina.2